MCAGHYLGMCAGHYLVMYAGHYLVKYAGHYLVKYAVHYLVMYAGHYLVMYAGHYTHVKTNSLLSSIHLLFCIYPTFIQTLHKSVMCFPRCSTFRFGRNCQKKQSPLL